MLIMCDKVPVAKAVYTEGNLKFPYKFVALEGVPQLDLPFPMFGLDRREATYEQFKQWISNRCMPPDRLDVGKMLKRLGLKRYDPMEIARKTKAVNEWNDKFWVDFDR